MACKLYVSILKDIQWLLDFFLNENFHYYTLCYSKQHVHLGCFMYIFASISSNVYFCTWELSWNFRLKPLSNLCEYMFIQWYNADSLIFKKMCYWSWWHINIRYFFTPMVKWLKKYLLLLICKVEISYRLMFTQMILTNSTCTLPNFIILCNNKCKFVLVFMLSCMV